MVQLNQLKNTHHEPQNRRQVYQERISRTNI